MKYKFQLLLEDNLLIFHINVTSLKYRKLTLYNLLVEIFIRNYVEFNVVSFDCGAPLK